MQLATILPHLAGLRFTRVEVLADELVLEAASRATTARCPGCGRRSRHYHGGYTRTVTDQPLGPRRVTIQLSMKRFRCRAPTCQRQTFAEPLPRLVDRYARRSVPLQLLLQDIGLTLGGRPGVRFAGRRGITISRMTLLRLVRALPEPAVTAPTVLGVDDFAVARGRRYGSVVVDLEAHRPVDLLPDRTSETLATWLTAHGQPDIICRDRGGDYAAGARRGAPEAVQVADRWHLLKNVGDTLERVLGRHQVGLRQAVPSPRATAVDAGLVPPVPVSEPAPPAPEPAISLPPPAVPAVPPSGARQARYEEAVTLRRQGCSISAISRQVGATRPTVRRWLRADAFPERARRPSQLHDLSPHAAYLRERWTAGCRNAAELWSELRKRGFTGSAVTVRRYLQAWRAYPRQRRPGGQHAAVTDAPAPAASRPPSPRQVRWWLLTPAADLEPEQQGYLDRLRTACPAVARAEQLAMEFGRLVRQRDPVAFTAWLEAAATSSLPEFREVANGMRRDRAAIEAALTHEWSSGQVEGQVTRIKLLKRQMFGRAKFDLLRKRVLLAR